LRQTNFSSIVLGNGHTWAAPAENRLIDLTTDDRTAQHHGQHDGIKRSTLRTSFNMPANAATARAIAAS